MTGALGTEPSILFTPPLPLSDAGIKILIEGEGPALDDGVALLSTTTFSGDDGSIIGIPAEPSLVEVERLSAESGIPDALRTATEGSRLLVTQAIQDEGTDRMEIVVIDVLPTRSIGDRNEIDFDGENLPFVAEDAEGHPSAHVGEGLTPPELLRVITLSNGAGRQVMPGDAVFAQYTVWTWSAGEVLDSTWEVDGVPRQINITEAFPGLRDGLLDQFVGSRVLVLIPPELGIGTDSLIAVVDILAVERLS